MKHLAFGPGAMGFFMYLGALSALSDVGALNELESISGASAGALLGVLYAVAKGDITRLLDICVTVPFKEATKPNIKVLLSSYGLVSTKKLAKLISDACVQFTGRTDFTFAELYAHNPIKIHVSACCVDLKKTHYFSVDTTPDMSVTQAICMSIAIPFVFQSVKRGPWRYIDGGTLEAIPCGALVGVDPKTALAFHISDEWDYEVKDFKSYAFCILGAAMGLREKYIAFPRLGLSAGDINVFDFGISNDAKIRLFVSGHAQTKKSLCKVHANDPACRPHETLDTKDDSGPGDAGEEPGDAGEGAEAVPTAEEGGSHGLLGQDAGECASPRSDTSSCFSEGFSDEEEEYGVPPSVGDCGSDPSYTSHRV
jgi:hypothetical protein